MDTIWSCGFGLETDMQNNINNPYLIFSQNIFNEDNTFRILVLLSLFITELNTVWLKLYHISNFIRYWLPRIFPLTRKFIQEIPDLWIIRQAYTMMEKRGQMAPTNRTDLIQLMLESASNEDLIQ
ncbi:unnamed protein product, partial [Rotaria sordida]